jgi:hypothetical protein
VAADGLEQVPAGVAEAQLKTSMASDPDSLKQNSVPELAKSGLNWLVLHKI